MNKYAYVAAVEMKYVGSLPVRSLIRKKLSKLGRASNQIPVDALGLSTRLKTGLNRANIKYVGQLMDCPWGDLLTICGMDLKSAVEILDRLDSHLSSPPSPNRYSQSKPAVSTEQSDESRLSTLTISSAVECLLQELEPREARVISLRYGLEDGLRRTLEEIGLEFEVSRERIRQIQAKALKRLRHPSKRKYVEAISAPFEDVFREAGGILKEAETQVRLMEITSTSKFHPAGLSRLILQLSPKFVEIGDEVWALVDYPLKYVPTIVENTVKLLEEHKTRIRFNILVGEIKREQSIGEAVPMLESAFIEACIKASPEVEVNSDGWCGLAKWRNRYLDEIVQVLVETQKPLHYTIIARGVNDLLSNKVVSDHSVHDLLQRERTVFVRVAPGTYGLRKWGLKDAPYYLALIREILRKAAIPLSAEEVRLRVSEIRPCKKSTVFMYLTLNDEFVQLESGKFVLREGLSRKGEEQSVPPSSLTASFVEQLKKETMAKLLTWPKSVNPEDPS